MFDLAICDEAHRLADAPGEEFGSALNPRQIVVRRPAVHDRHPASQHRRRRPLDGRPDRVARMRSLPRRFADDGDEPPPGLALGTKVSGSDMCGPPKVGE